MPHRLSKGSGAPRRPKNPLKTKLGAPLPEVKSERIQNAREAVRDLAPEFENWLENSLRRLANAREGYTGDPDATFQHGTFLRAVFDVKGLGTMIGYPLISRIAASLLRILESRDLIGQMSLGLIDRHIAAIHAVRAAQAHSPDSGPFGQLARELETEVQALTARR